MKKANRRTLSREEMGGTVGGWAWIVAVCRAAFAFSTYYEVGMLMENHNPRGNRTDGQDKGGQDTGTCDQE